MLFNCKIRHIKFLTALVPLALVACAGRGSGYASCPQMQGPCGAGFAGNSGHYYGAPVGNSHCGQPAYLSANGCGYGVNWVAVPTYRQVYVTPVPATVQYAAPVQQYVQPVQQVEPYVAPQPTEHTPYVAPEVVSEPYVAPVQYPSVPYNPPRYQPARK